MTSKPSVLVLDNYGFLDPYRENFYRSISDNGFDTLVLNTASSNEAELLSNFENWENSSNLQAVLSINASGISEGSVLSHVLHRVPLAVWFFDSPYYLGREIYFPPECLIYVASRDWLDHPSLSNSRYLPFAGAKPSLKANNPERDIGFLGNSHHIPLNALRTLPGIFYEDNQKVQSLRRLKEFIASKEFLLGNYKFENGSNLNPTEIYNFQASLDRIRQLQFFQDFDLDISGPADWLINLWSVAPNLLDKFNQLRVDSQESLEMYMQKFKVSLNIFHLQNTEGGPNFRTFDAACNGVATLSSRNSGCEEIFPHGIAAMYYETQSDAIFLAEELLTDITLRETLTKNSAEIVLSGNLHRDRSRKIVTDMGLACINEPKTLEFRDENLGKVNNVDELSAATFDNSIFWARLILPNSPIDLMPETPTRRRWYRH